MACGCRGSTARQQRQREQTQKASSAPRETRRPGQGIYWTGPRRTKKAE